MRLKVGGGGGGGGAGLHLGVVGGGKHSPPPWKLCAPPWGFQPFKSEYCSLYTRPPLTCFCPPPPLGIFLNEPLGGGGGVAMRRSHSVGAIAMIQ